MHTAQVLVTALVVACGSAVSLAQAGKPLAKAKDAPASMGVQAQPKNHSSATQVVRRAASNPLA
ncbi:MAG: hypothetical protein H7210_07320, partial [Pyrinomonadaceae bacterium]|nr:hypothetical protein [Phycisphaerales bacterium]